MITVLFKTLYGAHKSVVSALFFFFLLKKRVCRTDSGTVCVCLTACLIKSKFVFKIGFPLSLIAFLFKFFPCSNID